MTALLPPQRFEYAGVSVTRLADVAEAHEDRFGRIMQRVWCRREDTGAEGWVVYGEDARWQADGGCCRHCTDLVDYCCKPCHDMMVPHCAPCPYCSESSAS